MLCPPPAHGHSRVREIEPLLQHLGRPYRILTSPALVNRFRGAIALPADDDDLLAPLPYAAALALFAAWLSAEQGAEYGRGARGRWRDCRDGATTARSLMRWQSCMTSQGVVRDEGMTRAYVEPSFPAVASPEIVLALAQAGEDLGVRYHVGITRSSDSDFCGVGRPSVGGYLQPRHLEVLDYYRRAGVLSGDRESAALVTLPLLFGKRGGSICSVGDNMVTGEKFRAGAGHDTAQRVAQHGLAILARMDRAKADAGQRCWTPALRGR